MDESLELQTVGFNLSSSCTRNAHKFQSENELDVYYRTHQDTEHNNTPSNGFDVGIIYRPHPR